MPIFRFFENFFWGRLVTFHIDFTKLAQKLIQNSKIFNSIIGPNEKSKGTLLLQIFIDFENFAFLFHFIISCVPGRRGPICHFWCLSALPIRPKQRIYKIRESKIDVALSVKPCCVCCQASG